MKMSEDNILRATCEFHVFWTITTAFVMKSDLSHEKLDRSAYDYALLVTFVLCVPVTFCATMYSKYRRYQRLQPDFSLPEYAKSKVHAKSKVPSREFAQFSIGLALADYRAHMQE